MRFIIVLLLTSWIGVAGGIARADDGCTLFHGCNVLSELQVKTAEREAPASIDEVVGFGQSVWVPVTTPHSVNAGLTEGKHWFRLAWRNAEKRDFRGYLVINNPLLDHIEIHTFVDGKPFPTITTGDTRAFSNRLVDDTAFLMPVEITPLSTMVVYVALQTRDAMKTRIEFVEQNAWLLQRSEQQIIFFSIISTMLVLAIYHAVFYLKSRESAFIHYAWFEVCAIFFNLVQEGYAFRWWWPDLPRWHNFTDTLSVGLLIASGARYAMTHMREEHIGKGFHRALEVISNLAYSGAIIGIAFPYQWTLAFLLSLLLTGLVIGLAIAVRKYLTPTRLSIFFGIGWLVMMCGALARVFAELGWIPFSTLVTHASLLGVMLQSLFLALGMSDEYAARKRTILEAQQKLLEVERENTEVLEKRVAERTEDLSLALGVLEEEKRRAEQSSRHHRKLMATAAHDLRQPLHAMRLICDTAASGESHPVLQRLSEGLAHFSDVFDSLFDISRLDHASVTPHAECIDLTEFIASLYTGMEAVCRDAGIVLQTDIPSEDPVMCVTDTRMLSRMLWILVDNALAHSRCTTVMIRLNFHRNTPQIHVQDDGIGIPAHERENIFTEFYSLGNDTRNRRGMGLGLALCKRLGEAQGISLSVEEAAPQGTRFSLRFPGNE
jgi:signal transduction histidine kinase